MLPVEIPLTKCENSGSDYWIFFGPNAEKFLGHRRKLIANHKQLKVGWCWPVFFVWYVWYFYRKMYKIGFCLVLLPIVFTLLLPELSYEVSAIERVLFLGISFVFVVFAESMYIHHATKKINVAKQEGRSDAERTELIRNAGGVSLPAGILAGVVYCGQFLLLLFGNPTA